MTYYTKMIEEGKENITDEKTMTEKYINQLNDIHKQAMTIAKEHLETSFDITKSNGYKKWLQETGKN